MDNLEPQPPSAAGNTAEGGLVIPETAVPKLRALRDHEIFYTRGPMPADDPLFPGQTIEISSYQMNSYDPAALGMWKIEVPSVMKARLLSLDSADGLKHVLTMPSADKPGKYVPADSGTAKAVAGALELFDGDITAEELASWDRRNRPKPPKKRFLHFLGIKKRDDET